MRRNPHDEVYWTEEQQKAYLLKVLIRDYFEEDDEHFHTPCNHYKHKDVPLNDAPCFKCTHYID